jgi:hypothetical protein
MRYQEKYRLQEAIKILNEVIFEDTGNGEEAWELIEAVFKIERVAQLTKEDYKQELKDKDRERLAQTV